MKTIERDIRRQVEERAAQHLERKLRWFGGAQLPQSSIDGRDILLFSSSNYLSLAEDPEVIAAAAQALEMYGAGSGGSRLTTGSYTLQQELESTLAQVSGFESALLFTSGYHANVGVLSALGGPGTTIFSDEKNHASIIDGCRLGKSHIQIYRHRDSEHLESLLKDSPGGRKLIVSDSVFSMDGDIACVTELRELADRYDAWLVLDDAHGMGVLGAHGYGITEYASAQADILIGTLSKALGSLGGYVLCRDFCRRYLLNFARSFIFSTALPPAAVGAALAALRKVPAKAPQLRRNIAYMNELLQEADLISQVGETAIIPIAIGAEERAAKVAAYLYDEGVFIPCIRFPAVAPGEAILRLTVMADHTREQMEFAVEKIQEAMKKTN